jgi:hypothetical protein
MKFKRNATIEAAFSEPEFAVGADGTRIAYYIYGEGPEVLAARIQFRR